MILGVLGLVLSAWVIFAHDRIEVVRFATFNVSMIRDQEGQLAADLAGEDPQARAVAEVIQRVAPDVLLLNEFDFDPDGEALRLFGEQYLGVGQNGAPPMRYDFSFSLPVNGFGSGSFPGKHGMVLLSRYPILPGEARTFQQFTWQSMPSALLPDSPAEVLQGLRLSSKSHWDLSVVLSAELTVHVLVSHPTPPISDENRRRNHDEVRFWADYINPQRAGYIVDDRGGIGGLAAGAAFVIMGDLNADPSDGDSLPGTIGQLLENPRVQGNTAPRSEGGVEQSQLQWAANSLHRGDPGQDTADFDDTDGPGNLRVDYVLPSVELQVEGLGVFWPRRNDPLFVPVGTDPFPGSDHRLVWLDVRVR